MEWKMRHRLSKSQQGFSLLEGLVAVAIIMIVMGMAMLNFGTVLPNYKANSAMDQLLYQMRSARERAIAHRIEVQVQFVGTNQIKMTEIWTVGTAPAPVTVSFEGGAQFMTIASVPDTPMAFGNAGPICFAGGTTPPPIMKFTTNGSFIDGGNTLVNGTVFLAMPGGKPSTARAITILGATGRVRPYHYDGTAWQE
jgi:type II secretory pathway pseudopilin PulG